MSTAVVSMPAHAERFNEAVPTITILSVIEDEPEDEECLEMPKRLNPWMAKTLTTAVPLAPAKAPVGSPIVDDASTEGSESYSSSEAVEDDCAIADDDDDDLWLDSPSASVNNAEGTAATGETDSPEDSLNFKRLPPVAYKLRKSASMLSLAFKSPELVENPVMSRTRSSRAYLNLRHAQAGESLVPKSNLPHNYGPNGRIDSFGLPPTEPQASRLMSEKEIRHSMLGTELSDDDRRTLRMERRWPWGWGVDSPPIIRNETAEREKLIEMFTQPPMQAACIKSWGYPLGQDVYYKVVKTATKSVDGKDGDEESTDGETSGEGEEVVTTTTPPLDEEQLKYVLLFKAPTCTW